MGELQLQDRGALKRGALKRGALKRGAVLPGRNYERSEASSYASSYA